MSQVSLSKGMDQILDAFIKILSQYSKFFVINDELSKNKHNFFVDLEFPNVVGAVNCTRIWLKKPVCSDWIINVDRTSHFSMNIQMVCIHLFSNKNFIAVIFY